MSNSIEPLYISSGQPADGENKFFPRDKIVNQIWRKLKRGEDLLLTAPRRVGKSSILHYVKNNPHDGYIVKYLSIMGKDNANDYFKLLYDALLENDEVFGFWNSFKEKRKLEAKSAKDKVSGLGLDGVRLEGKVEIDYFEKTIELLKSLPKETKRVIFLLDEFPETVSNIAMDCREKAIKFLQDNRDLRQLNHDADIQFIITGSIGLGNVVKRLTNDNHLINDLTLIEIEPLEDKEAFLMIDRLCLGLNEESISLSFSDEAKSYLLQKIVQNLPYYIQMIVDEMVDEGIESVREEEIDMIIDKIIKSRSNADYFSNWKTRLGDAFEKKEESVAIEVLSHISINDTMSHDEMKKIDKKIEINAIIEVLEYDGYISAHNGLYIPILNQTTTQVL
jgi:hypothetical protein